MICAPRATHAEVSEALERAYALALNASEALPSPTSQALLDAVDRARALHVRAVVAGLAPEARAAASHPARA